MELTKSQASNHMISAFDVGELKAMSSLGGVNTTVEHHWQQSSAFDAVWLNSKDGSSDWLLQYPITYRGNDLHHSATPHGIWDVFYFIVRPSILLDLGQVLHLYFLCNN